MLTIKKEIEGFNDNLKGSRMTLHTAKNDEEHKNKIFKNMDENKEKIKKRKSILSEFEERYYEKIKNSRKIEKVIKDIKSKEKIEDIHNFEKREYKRLIFITSIFQQFYFDYYYRFKREGVFIFNDLLDESNPLYNNYSIKNIFLDFIKDYFKNNIQAVNRLLYFEPEDENVKKRIENLNENSVINEENLKRYLEDIKIYSQRLDRFDMEVTKEKYKIIEEKLIELEKIEKEKIYKIIKENEEIICRLNYLTYPDNLGIFENIKYKFNNEIIYMMYRELEDILRPRRSRSHNELGDMLKTIIIYYYFEKENFIEMQEIYRNVNLDEINEMIDKIKPKEEILKRRKEKDISSITKVENIIYDMVLNFLMIIKINMEKKELTIIEELKLKNWEEYDLKQKEELLNIVENDFESIKEKFRESPNSTLFMAIKKKSDLLKNIIEKEEDQRLILKLDDLIRVIEYRLVEFEILKKANDINIELDNDKRKSLKKELLSFIKIKSKEERLQYIFSWHEIIEKLGKIGIVVEEGEWVIKFQGEMEEEEERGEGIEEETEELYL